MGDTTILQGCLLYTHSWKHHPEHRPSVAPLRSAGKSETPRELSPQVDTIPEEHLSSKGRYVLASPFGVVQLLSCVWLFVTPRTAACQASLSFTISWSLLKLRSIESVMPSNHLILCRPLLLLPSISLSIRVFSSESALRIRWPKCWSFSFSPSSGYSGLISLKIDWFDILVVWGTLKGLLQHHSWKASILQFSAFFMVQLSHLYMTTGKTIALIIQTFVSKVMSLLFNMLSRLVIAFLSRNKCLLIHDCSHHPQWFWSLRK